MDCIPEDEIWHPEAFEGAQGLFHWGPPPPPSFLNPDDLAADDAMSAAKWTAFSGTGAYFRFSSTSDSPAVGRSVGAILTT
jgi:hypothetical protein